MTKIFCVKKSKTHQSGHEELDVTPRPDEEQLQGAGIDPALEHDDEYGDPVEMAGQDEMDAMMNQYLDKMTASVGVGQMLRVPLVAIHATHAMVDVGEKAEGMINIRELTDIEGNPLYKPGDVIEAIVKGQDEETGLLILSHSEAARRVALQRIEEAAKNNTPIKGRVSKVTKGGLLVEIGTTAFLPASQIDRKRIENFDEWVGQEVECYVIEFVPEKRRIILSRRKMMEETETARRNAIFENIKKGQTIEGTVKKLVEFGAFVDLGGIDGLVPRSEISWHRMAKPEEYLKVGETVPLKVIDADRESGKITLSRRQLQPDPWEHAVQAYALGAVCEGEVVSITNYGAFVRLEEGLDGMIHISDMAWDAQGKQPSNYLTVGQRVQVSILGVDPGNRRISLGLKQLTNDPWAEIPVRYPEMTRVKGKVTGITKYGAFIEIEPGIEGMIHVSDFAWEKRVNHPREMVNRGDEVEACVLKVDLDQRRISLGVKQLRESPIQLYSYQHKVGNVVEGEIVNVTEFGAFLRLTEGVEGFIHVSQLDKGRVDVPAQNFKPGQKVQAEITKIDLDSGKVSLSRRQFLKREEKEILSHYKKSTARSSAGTSLGELLSELVLDDDLPKE